MNKYQKMNNLEFIEKEIENAKELLQRLEKLKVNSNKYELQLNEVLEKDTQKKLFYLLQIKSILEAWEVVKHTIYKRKMGEESFIQVMGGVYNEGQCWTSGINPYEIIKKSLEVEE